MATFVPSSGKSSPARTGYYAGQNGFPINSATGGNCTWYAYGRFCEIAGQWVPMSAKGNAVTFYESFPTCKKGSTPSLGAIACWGYYGSKNGDPGHVGVIEQIHSNGDAVMSNSGWSTGWMGLTTLKKSNGYNLTFNNAVFKGFIYNPISFDGVSASATELTEGTSYIDMKQRASQLYSSDNYKYLSAKEKESDPWLLTSAAKYIANSTAIINNVIEDMMNRIRTTKPVQDKGISGLFNTIVDELTTSTIKQEKKRDRSVNSYFDLSTYLVEAPFVEVDIGGYKIGRYDNNIDEYPNYINSLQINKTNGEINLYSINLVHQIRAGEDPNLIDKLIARNQFNKITITYGDISIMQSFKDTSAIISNIKSTRNYTSNKITYQIEAMSTCSYITGNKTNFPQITDKPSNVIRNLLYNSELSNDLQSVFPAMANQTDMEKKGYIPTNDSVVNISGMNNTDPITYINHAVSCMSNETQIDKIIKDSTYFINYNDSADGAYFNIMEVKNDTDSLANGAVYEVTVGYPDNNNIFDFKVEDDKSWSVLYDRNTNSKTAKEYVYTIEDSGDINKQYSPNISYSSNVLSETDKNWWSYMVKFPISGTLTMRGIFKPVLLTDYIKINVVFYGQPHVTSGLYMITGQRDTVSGSGFRTDLSVIRVGEK